MNEILLDRLKFEAASGHVFELVAFFLKASTELAEREPNNKMLRALEPAIFNMVDALKGVRASYRDVSINGVFSGARALFENLLALEMLEKNPSLAQDYINYGTAVAHIHRVSHPDIFPTPEVNESEAQLRGVFSCFVRIENGQLKRRQDGSVIDVKWHGQKSIAGLTKYLKREDLYATFYSIASNYTHVNANTSAILQGPNAFMNVLLAGYFYATVFAYNGLHAYAEIFQMRLPHVVKFGEAKKALRLAETEMAKFSI